MVPTVSARGLLVGDQLPPFIATDLNGKTVDLNKIIGRKPIMLVFWSTWCVDCKEKLPKINKLVNRYSDNGLEFIGINIGIRDTEEKAREYVKEQKMTYTNVFDKTGKLKNKYRLHQVFEVIVAAKDGTVVMKYNTVPEFGNETLHTLQTHVYPNSKAATNVEPKK